jgi:hypothetical protein
MKLGEIVNFYQTASDDALLEHVEQNNDTGLSSTDVVKIIRTGNDPGAWSEPMTGDQLSEYLVQLVGTPKNVQK